MFQKVFEYAGPHKKGLYAATAVVLVSVLMGVLPFVLAYQVIAPLVMGAELDASFLILRVALVLVCLVLQAVLYGWGLNLSHKAAYDTLLRLRTALQKRFEKLPLGVIQDKGTGTVKKLFVDDVDSLEVLLAHSMPEGIANLMVPIAVYVAMFFVDWKLALLSLASIPISLIAMMTMYSVGMKKMGPYYMAGQKMNNTIIEYINGMEVVKVFNKDADSYERFRKDVSDYRDYTLAWYKAAWPWMAIYSSLLPCTVILTLPLGAWFVLSGWSALPDLILVLCLSLSIGMPLLKSLGFLPTMPSSTTRFLRWNRFWMRRSFSRRRTASTARIIPSFMTMFPLATPRHSPARTESPWWWRMRYSTTSALRPRPDRKRPWWESLAQARALWQNC